MCPRANKNINLKSKFDSFTWMRPPIIFIKSVEIGKKSFGRIHNHLKKNLNNLRIREWHLFLVFKSMSDINMVARHIVFVDIIIKKDKCIRRRVISAAVKLPTLEITTWSIRKKGGSVERTIIVISKCEQYWHCCCTCFLKARTKMLYPPCSFKWLLCLEYKATTETCRLLSL